MASELESPPLAPPTYTIPPAAAAAAPAAKEAAAVAPAAAAVAPPAEAAAEEAAAAVAAVAPPAEAAAEEAAAVAAVAPPAEAAAEEAPAVAAVAPPAEAAAEAVAAEAIKSTTKSKGTFQASINKFSKAALFFFNKSKAAVPERLIKIFHDPHKESIPAKDEPDKMQVKRDEDKMQVKRDEDIKKYQAILEEYSKSKGTVFRVDPENNTVKVAEQASISQNPEKGLKRIKAQRAVTIDGETFTITAITDVDKGSSDEHQKQIKENLEGLVASIKDDKEFLNKLKEVSDLKDGLRKDANLLSGTNSLFGYMDPQHELGPLKYAQKELEIQNKIEKINILNQELGDKLSNNLKNRELVKTAAEEVAPPAAAEEVALEAAKTPELLEEVAPETLAKDEIKKVDEPAKTHEEIIPLAAETAEIPLAAEASVKEPDSLEVTKETTPQDYSPVLTTSAEKAAAEASVKEPDSLEVLTPTAPTLETPGKLDASTVEGGKFEAFKKTSIEISPLAERQVPEVAQTVPEGVAIAKTAGVSL